MVAPATAQADSKPAGDADAFLNLIIRLRDKGQADVVKAKEVPGKVILRQDRVSDYLYEVTREGKTSAVGFLPEDPFVTRGFAGPEHQREESTKAAQATIVINVPQTRMAVAESGKLGIRIYKINSGVVVERITPAELEKLLSENEVALKAEITGAELGRAATPSQ